MAMRLDIRATGTDTVSGRLRGIAARARGPRPALERILEQLVTAHRVRLSRGQGGLRRLAPSTIARKLRQGLSRKPLRGSTGDLLDSVMERAHSRGVRSVRGHELRFGSRVFYGRYHQFGEGGMPRRRVVNVTTKDRGPISETITDHLMGRRIR